MSDSHEARDPKREPQIDTVGWLFAAAAAVIIAVAAVIAYQAHEASVANAAVSHVVAR
jgi:hypothetical protein